MRVERTLVGILCVAAVAVSGCGGRLAYNLPPASQLMEPGPGVGGPGPGVIPPAGYPYGMYGGAVGRFDDGAGGYTGGEGYGECAQCGPMPPGGNYSNGVVQASYADCCGGACECGDECGCGPGCTCGCESMNGCDM